MGIEEDGDRGVMGTEEGWGYRGNGPRSGDELGCLLPLAGTVLRILVFTPCHSPHPAVRCFV